MLIKAALLLSFAFQAGAEIPVLNAPVVDLGHVLSPSMVNELNSLLLGVKRQGGPQISVLTVPDMGGETVESYSIQVVDKTKLGTAKEDNGVLLLLALKERKVRIEVGQGLEGELTDALSRRIIDLSIVPRLKRGDIDGAIQQGVLHILETVYPQALSGDQRLETKPHSRDPDIKHLLILATLFIIFSFFMPRRRRRFMGGLGGIGGFPLGGGSWGGGSSGGGWSGGGGGFSGGGSSGSW